MKNYTNFSSLKLLNSNPHMIHMTNANHVHLTIRLIRKPGEPECANIVNFPRSAKSGGQGGITLYGGIVTRNCE